jgi:hypothetical protein
MFRRLRGFFTLSRYIHVLELLVHVSVNTVIIIRSIRDVIRKLVLREGFEVLTALVMKSTIFWDITPCSPL